MFFCFGCRTLWKNWYRNSGVDYGNFDFNTKKTSLFGAVMGFGVMVGAIFAHLFVLGIEVKNDGRTLFALANIILFSCPTLIFLNRNKTPNLLKFKI